MWITRHIMNSDGLSYVDIARNYAEGNFKDAFNTFWSPFYSWIIAIVFILFKPSTYMEFTYIHIINYTAFVLSLIGFNYFLKELIQYRERIIKENENTTIISHTLLILLSYSLFIWTSLKFVTLWIVSPDMILAVFLYFCFGLLISINRRPQKSKFILLGILLGIAYFVKPIILWLSIPFIVGALYASNDKKKFLTSAIFSFVLFIGIISPYVYLMSQEKNRLTFADSGKLMLLWEINHVTNTYMVHWQGGDGTYGKPIHPSRKLYSHPRIFEFGTPISGTYPAWYDPTYWYEGAKPKLTPDELVKPFIIHAFDYFAIYIVLQGILLISAIFLILKSTGDFYSNFKKQMFYLSPAIAALILITIMLPELRYMCVYLVVLWTAVFSCLVLPKYDENIRLSKSLPIMVSGLLIFITLFAKFYPSDFCYSENIKKILLGKPLLRHNTWIVYKELQNMGLKEGDKVATIGHGFFATWAHFGKNKIIAEIPNKDERFFWHSTEEKRQNIYAIFKFIGVKAIVAETVPKYADLAGWKKIDDTSYYVYFLN